jgi:anthrone oxygenase-like protein
VHLLQLVTLALAGLLAGEEFIVRWGVAPALRALDDGSHVRARIALVKRLRVVVPVLIVPTVVAAAMAAVQVDGPAAWSGFGALVVFVLCSAFGTVPINMQVSRWDAGRPPVGWRRTVHRWERIDVVRSAAAVVGFVLLLIGLTT